MMTLGPQTFIAVAVALLAGLYLGWDALGALLRKDCAPRGCSGCPKGACPAHKLQEELAKLQAR